MKLKGYIDKDIKKFRRLNISISDKSEDEVVRKIEEKFGIRNETINLVDDLNKLLGRRKKIGFTLESFNLENIEELKKIDKRRKEKIKLKLLESNSLLAEMKEELENKLLRRK